MSHFSPSTPQSHSLFHCPSPFLVPRFLWLFIVGPLLYHKRGLTVAKRRGAPENQLQTDWKTTLNENEISVPWDTCLPPEEVPELLAWPKVEQKPRVIWEPTFPSPWGLMHFTKHLIPHSQALSPEHITKLSLVLYSIPEPPCLRVVLPEDCSQPFHSTPSFQTFHHPRKVFELRQPLRSILCGLSKPCQYWAWFKGKEAGILLQSNIYMIKWPFSVLHVQMPIWQLLSRCSLIWILHTHQADLLTSHPQQCVQSLHCHLSESNPYFIPIFFLTDQQRKPLSLNYCKVHYLLPTANATTFF